MGTFTFAVPTVDTAEMALAPNWPNSYAIGRLLKEYARRAMEEIRRGRLSFVAEAKLVEGKGEDVVTNVDRECQMLLIQYLLEDCPGIGIIAEESSVLDEIQDRFPKRPLNNIADGYLHIPCEVPGLEEGVTLYAIIDPLDGTKAYARRQRGGTATQVALVAFAHGKYHVLAAVIADVTSGELFAYRPGSVKMHRITDLRHSEYLSETVAQRHVEAGMAVTRTEYLRHSPTARKLLAPREDGGLVKGSTTESGSMSLTYATLWTTAVLLIAPPKREHCWDSAPNIGICQRLGYQSFAIEYRGPKFTDPVIRAYDYPLQPEPFDRNFEILWIHESQKIRLARWCTREDIRFELAA